MRRFLTQALASVAVLTALAVLDLGPRASAAYLSTADRSVGASSRPDAAPSDPVRAQRDRDGHPVDINLCTGTGGVAPETSGPSGGGAPVAVLLPRELPSGNRVTYYREPASHFKIRDYTDFILDPPRQV